MYNFIFYEQSSVYFIARYFRLVPPTSLALAAALRYLLQCNTVSIMNEDDDEQVLI